MTRLDVTVCTPSIPHRHEMLKQCMESVRKQTAEPQSHLIGIDYARVGGAKMLNNLISQATTEWIVPLADDDILYPNFIERLVSEAGDADMIYPWCEVTGTRKNWNPNSHLDIERLRTDNYIPATVLIRRSTWEELGGYPDVVCEDHAMWVKMIEAGKTIKCLPEVLWEYRFHGRNISDGEIPPWEV